MLPSSAASFTESVRFFLFVVVEIGLVLVVELFFVVAVRVGEGLSEDGR